MKIMKKNLLNNNLSSLKDFSDKYKVSFVITIGERVFEHIDRNDERYIEGRAALDLCWKWIENGEISGDSLYELIDNAECTGISEFAEDEENINISKLWYLLVDIVTYISWLKYKNEKVKYLPQALESINKDSILVLIENALETTFITEKEIYQMYEQILTNLDFKENMIKKENFISIVYKNKKNIE